MASWPEGVDLRVLNLAPLPFQFEVTARGERFWVADTGRVADWESLTWRKYWDLQPLLEENWRSHVRQVMEQKNELERRGYQASLARIREVHRRVREAADDYTPDIPE